MTKYQISRIIGKMSDEQKAHLQDQINLRLATSRFMGKSVNEGKLNVALKALEGKRSA